jgi:murein L,D-transpeptidase YcbB/YkuD
MILKMASRVTLAVCLSGFSTLALAQEAKKPQPPADLKLDAAPAKETADPLTPPEQDGPAPVAPNAPAEKPAEVVQAPVPEPDPIATQILARLSSVSGKAEAREDSAGLAAYYNAGKGQPIWVSKEGLSPNALKVIKEIRNADDWGLDASAFQVPANPGGAAKPEALADAELKLSLAVLKYARYARGGRLDPPSLSEVIDRRPHIYDPKSVLRAIAAAESADAYLRGLHPKHEQFKRLRQALLAMNKGGSGGGSVSRIPAGPNFRPGDNDPQIAVIRKRLGAGLDGRRDTVYDTALLQAVNRYQKEHGLRVTGIIDQSLRASLNGSEDGRESRSAARESASGSSDERKLRILANMERWRWMPDDLGGFYVWDSIPEQVTRVFDHGKLVLMERIVVGRPTTPTPTFSANMQFVTFNPEWAVPEGIKVNEIAPKLQQGGRSGGDFFNGYGGGGGSSQVLQRLGGLRVTYGGREIDPDSVDWSSVDIRRFQFIQGPGERNVLGVVKFRFPNKHDVYMHDTPDRHLFNQTPRTFSHGCMRTENPLHLAEVILAHDKNYSAGQIREMVQSGVTNEIKLNSVVPVHVAYFTAEVDDQGQVHFFPDVYGVDSRVASALRGRAVHFSSDPVVTAENQDRRQVQRNDPYQRYDSYQQNGPYQQRPYQQPYGPYQGWGSPYQRGADPRYQPRGQPWNPYQDWN